MKLITTLLAALATAATAALAQETNRTERTTNGTEIVEKTFSGGVPVYKITKIPSTNAAPATIPADGQKTWAVDPNAQPVSIADLPGYRPPVAWYEPPPQDTPYDPETYETTQLQRELRNAELRWQIWQTRYGHYYGNHGYQWGSYAYYQ